MNVNEKLSSYSTTSEMNAAITLKANEISSEVSNKVGNDEVISKINQTPESIGIAASKININGVITAINDNNSTTINGNKITTGTITANQVASDIITTNNFSAQEINADNIKSGSLNADRISGGTINANNINVTNISASNVNKGTLSGANIDIYNGTGFLKMLSGSAYHPYVSALNIASYANTPSASGAGLSFRSATNRSSTGNQIGYISYGANGSANYYASGNLNMQAGGNASLYGSSYTRIQQNMYFTSDSIRFYANNSTTAQIVSGGESIYLKPKSSGYAYVGAKSDLNKISTSMSGPSSKNVKTNLKEIKLDEIYNDFKKINVYDYDYKYSNLGNENYGFIIDEIENTNNLSKYFKSYEVKKEIIDDKLFPANEDSKNTINVKEWHRDSYIKGMFVVMKSMQEEIEFLKKELEELKNAKN